MVSGAIIPWEFVGKKKDIGAGFSSNGGTCYLTDATYIIMQRNAICCVSDRAPDLDDRELIV